MPSPDVLGRNGTYAAVRKIHTNVAAWRQYLRAHTSTAQEEALLGGEVGRALAEWGAADADAGAR